MKGLLRYISDSMDIGLSYGKYSNSISIIEYCDSNFVKDLEFKKSTPSYIFTIGRNCIYIYIFEVMHSI